MMHRDMINRLAVKAEIPSNVLLCLDSFLVHFEQHSFQVHADCHKCAFQVYADCHRQLGSCAFLVYADCHIQLAYLLFVFCFGFCKQLGSCTFLPYAVCHIQLAFFVRDSLLDL